MEEDLVAHLLANTALAQLVGDRITWLVRDQGAALPALVLTVIDGPPQYMLRSRSGLVGYLVQVDAWGASYADAKHVSRAADAALQTLAAPFRGPGFIERGPEDDPFRADAPGGDGRQDLFRTSLDVRVWHLTS